jgi:uncharacterized membrane protein
MMFGPGGGQALHCFGFGGGFFPVLPILLFTVFLGLAIAAVVMLARKGRPAANRQALETLANRFAAGEISEEEFESKKKALKG